MGGGRWACGVADLDEDHEEVPGNVAVAVFNHIKAARVWARPQGLLVQPTVPDLQVSKTPSQSNMQMRGLQAFARHMQTHWVARSYMLGAGQGHMCASTMCADC